jgi:hypothetical protein
VEGIAVVGVAYLALVRNIALLIAARIAGLLEQDSEAAGTGTEVNEGNRANEGSAGL